jgi:hypothetical protein
VAEKDIAGFFGTILSYDGATQVSGPATFILRVAIVKFNGSSDLPLR